ncbi:hypothetical protein SK128_022504 [Halocaridina rubra]|uniref:Uncharacterized protein n=1 Tax=Halocaridina rubra TaxID=373956 RepID=A0AAN8XEK7_HALRR
MRILLITRYLGISRSRDTAAKEPILIDMACKRNKPCLWFFFSFINAFVLFVSYTYGTETLDVFPNYSLNDVNGDYLFNDPAGKECVCKARLMAKVSCQVATILKLPNGSEVGNGDASFN